MGLAVVHSIGGTRSIRHENRTWGLSNKATRGAAHFLAPGPIPTLPDPWWNTRPALVEELRRTLRVARRVPWRVIFAHEVGITLDTARARNEIAKRVKADLD
jgi:hypothetical protein